MSQNVKIKRLILEFTRQTDITPYAAQDVVGPTSSGTIAQEFVVQNSDDSLGRVLVHGASYQVKEIRLTKSGNSTTNASFDVYLYSSGVTTAFDNQPHTITYANKHVRIGKTSLTLATAGSGSDCAEFVATDVNLTFKAIGTSKGATSGSIYAILVATAAYTPGVSEKFFIEVELFRIDE